MKKKDGARKRAGNFLSGSGFYIVLLLCVGVIGVSAWAMLTRDMVYDGLDMPVLGEAPDWTDWAQLPPPPPNVPTFGGATPAPQETEEPDADETFFWRDEEGEPEPTEEPTEAPVYVPPEPLQFVWPVAGEVEVFHSLDELIFDRTMGDWRTHAGIDIRADLGETVLAASGGVVERIFRDDLLGMTVLISHGQGVHTLYANLMENTLVEEGQWVSMGTPIGAVGATAIAKSGIVHHLHLEFFEDGVRVDPLRFLPDRNF